MKKQLAVALIMFAIGFLAAMGAAHAAPPGEGPGAHVVRTGDTLTAIAQQHGTTVAALAEENGLQNPDGIYIGQRLAIPSRATEDVEPAASLNQLPSPDWRYWTHVVLPGDTLTTIADRYRTTAKALIDLNELDSREVNPGQRLKIPRPRPGGVSSGSVSSATESESVYYTVRSGDTLTAIARQHGTTTTAIARLNGIDPEYISPGQRLEIPAPVGGAATLLAPETIYHRVQSGDTLSAIAERYGTTTWAVIRANDLANASAIYAGQKLSVPRSGQVHKGPAPGPKWIEVDVSEQRVRAWQGETLMYSFIASTGLPSYPTRRGSFRVQSKLPVATSRALNLSMPSWLGIYWAGPLENGFHGLPSSLTTGHRLWAGYLGRPISYGCIVLGTYDAQVLYDWADEGIRVRIHD